MTEPTFCTVISRNYAAFAQVLAESLAEHHPEARLRILVVDAVDGEGLPAIPAHPDAELITPASLGLEPAELHRLATASPVQMLVSRLKPLLVGELRRRHGPVVLFDADSYVYAPMGELGSLLADHSVLLTPHIRSLAGVDVRSPFETGPLLWGIHNGGFTGLGAGPQAGAFAEWWWQRCRALIVPDLASPLSYSQIWLDHAITAFGGLSLEDPGINASLFDLVSGDIEWTGNAPAIGGRPLRHFHFLGRIDPERPHEFSTEAHQAATFPEQADRPGASRLYREYFERLRAAGLAEGSPPRFDRAPDGRTISAADRTVYREGLYSAEVAGTAEPPNPFEHGSAAFFGWLELIREQRATAGPGT